MMKTAFAEAQLEEGIQRVLGETQVAVAASSSVSLSALKRKVRARKECAKKVAGVWTCSNTAL
ncbi:hypothetical protein GN244_ATG11297 [Phytophthora infestans]|uniref:Uncharacterized protein n=1 Tax=Phytophthora infestans TaxID=4787 RepID=A0A833W0C0_PHYIN|nr:hypothetical protein GN244_ATG11297 [Phytophthora infestans]